MPITVATIAQPTARVFLEYGGSNPAGTKYYRIQNYGSDQSNSITAQKVSAFSKFSSEANVTFFEGVGGDTTVSSSSAAGGYKLMVTSSFGYTPGDVIVVEFGTARQEILTGGIL